MGEISDNHKNKYTCSLWRILCNFRSGHLCKVHFYILLLISFQASMFLQSAEKSHPTKMPFSRASCMFHSHRPARSSSRILQKDVGASNLEGASPSPYLIFFNQPQFADCDNCDIYDVSATLRMRSSLALNFAQWVNFWDNFLVLVPNFKQSAGKYWPARQ